MADYKIDTLLDVTVESKQVNIPVVSPYLGLAKLNEPSTSIVVGNMSIKPSNVHMRHRTITLAPKLEHMVPEFRSGPYYR